MDFKHHNLEEKELFDNIALQEKDSVLLKENPDRYIIFPIQHKEIWDLYTKHRINYWVESDVPDLAQDLADLAMLDKDEREYIEYVLAFFASSDGIVAENINMRFINDVQLPEARFFYAFQTMMENVHNSTYALLLDAYVADPNRKRELFHAIDNIPSIKEKAEWALKWLHADLPFTVRLIAFICVEGIFFSGSFCCIYWMKSRGLLPGLSFANHLISKDEGLHADFGILLYKLYLAKLPDNIIHDIIGEAVSIEERFTCEAIKNRLTGMNADMMNEYIRFIANRWLIKLGHPILYEGATQPFTWMERISLNKKSSFFEKKNVEYQILMDVDLTAIGDDDF